jgi:hypothetical protein
MNTIRAAILVLSCQTYGYAAAGYMQMAFRKPLFRIQRSWKHANPSKSRHGICSWSQQILTYLCTWENKNIMIHLLIYILFNDLISSSSFMIFNIKTIVDGELERSDRVPFEGTIPIFVLRSLGKQRQSSARIVGILAKTRTGHLRNKVGSVTAWANWSRNLMIYWYVLGTSGGLLWTR